MDESWCYICGKGGLKGEVICAKCAADPKRYCKSCEEYLEPDEIKPDGLCYLCREKGESKVGEAKYAKGDETCASCGVRAPKGTKFYDEPTAFHASRNAKGQKLWSYDKDANEVMCPECHAATPN